MKHVGVFIFIALTCACCGGTSGGGGNSDVCGGISQACITGQVIDANTGSGVGSVVVSAGGTAIATGNAQGWFFASDVNAGTGVSLCFSADGYVETCRSVALVGTQTLSMTATEMIPKREQTIEDADKNTGTVRDDTTGAQATFPPSSICKSDRTTVATGDVSCTITPIDVTGNDIENAPGDYTAVSGGVTGQVYSSAMINLNCTQDGEELDLCNGITIVLLLPIYGTVATCGDVSINPVSTSLWRFNGETGIWDYYTTATKTCGASVVDRFYATTINRLGWWNAGSWFNTSCLKGSIISTMATPVTGAQILCRGVDYQSLSITYSTATGSFCSRVKPGGQYLCTTTKGSFASSSNTGTASDGLASCDGSASGCLAIGQLEITDSLMRAILTWGVDPSDLDAHFIGDGVQIYFGNKTPSPSTEKGSVTSSPFIELDTDDTTSYGPEIVTMVPDVTAGSYYFCVHNFSGEARGSIADSGAAVHVFAADFVQLYHVPTNNPNEYNLWRVFRVDVSETGALTFTEINEIVNGLTSVVDACRGT